MDDDHPMRASESIHAVLGQRVKDERTGEHFHRMLKKSVQQGRSE
jgi:hypothetical protein